MYSLTVSDPQLQGNPLVFVSPGFEALTGYAGEELLGRNCKLLQGRAPDRDKVAQLQQGLQDRAFTSVELTNYRKDGRAFQNLLCVLPVLDGYGNVLRFVGVQCDLDERKRAAGGGGGGRDAGPAAAQQAHQAEEHGTAKWQEQVCCACWAARCVRHDAVCLGGGVAEEPSRPCCGGEGSSERGAPLFLLGGWAQVHHYLTAFMLTDNSHDHAPIVAVSPGFTALTG